MSSEEGLLVVQDLKPGKKGSYALVRAKDWETSYAGVQIWRGPEKPYEIVDRKYLSRVSCKTVVVDQAGFFVCIPLSGEERERVFFSSLEVPEEDLAEMAIQEGEVLLDELANEKAAEALSYVDDDLADKYGNDIWIMASVGDQVAVNGELVWKRNGAKPPRGYIKTEEGGRFNSGNEEIDIDSLAEMTSRLLSQKLDMDINILSSRIRSIFKSHWGRDYISWSSSSGYSEVWVSKKAKNAYERRVEKEAREKELRERQQALEARRREQEARREKIRGGKWPSSFDWSPTGRLPGED